MVFRPQYNESLFKEIHDQVGPMRDIIKRAKASGLDQPLPFRYSIK